MNYDAGFTVVLLDKALEVGRCVGMPHSNEGGQRYVRCQVCDKITRYSSFGMHVMVDHEGFRAYLGTARLLRDKLYLKESELKVVRQLRKNARRRLKRAKARNAKVCAALHTDQSLLGPPTVL